MVRRRGFVVCSILALAVAVLPSALQPADAVEGPRTHLVKGGETLSVISLAYGIPVDDIVTLNNLPNPNFIVEGRSLQLPTGAGSTGAGSTGQREYIVRPGDSLSKIAEAHQTTIAALVQSNHLSDPDRLRVGQRLIVPEGQTRQSPASQTPSAQATLSGLLATQAPSGARVGIVAVNLKTGERVEHRAHEIFPAASVAKLPILVEATRQIEAGTLKLDGGAREDLRAMIANSDNPAANRVLDHLGAPKVNATMASLGLKATAVRNHFASGGPSSSGLVNQTSPSDMAHLLQQIANEQVVSAAASRTMRDLLLTTQDASKLRRLLPPDARVASKSGWYQGVANDVGIVYSANSRWVLAVFTEGSADGESANRLIASISQALYRAWSQR